MWIQVRTIDGTETQTIDDLSRLTKIECLREKIQETFRVSPDRQRLFYRGKQVSGTASLRRRAGTAPRAPRSRPGRLFVCFPPRPPVGSRRLPSRRARGGETGGRLPGRSAPGGGRCRRGPLCLCFPT